MGEEDYSLSSLLNWKKHHFMGKRDNGRPARIPHSLAFDPAGE